jgi:uncharacterized protein (DUF983 family)
MNHSGIVSVCATCHNGQVFVGVTPASKPINHLPTSATCETCHAASQFTNFANTPMVHTGIVSGCASCHNGQVFAGVIAVNKPGNHLPTSLACETCHAASQFTNFAGTAMNHVGILNNCTSCHSDGMTFAGVTPKRKQDAPTTHVTTTLDCSSCHSSTTTFAGASGGSALPSNHLPTTQTCTLCHASGTGPGSGVMNHSGIFNGCATCHNGQVFLGVTPVSKPGNHLPTSLACETCHATTKFTNFSGTAMVHTGIVNGCATCHNGQVFAGVTPVTKPSNHLPTSLSCETCHAISQYSSFYAPAMNHTGIVSDCASCHNGQVFFGVTPVSKPSNHLPTTATCETCHAASKFTSFSGTAMNHVGILSGCTTCHNGQVFAGVTPISKLDAPTPHLTTTLDCSSCHSSTTTFTGASGGTALPANHLPTTQTCTLCHASGTGPGSGVMNHNGILSGCATCHNGQVFVGVTPVAKPGNHLPTSLACEACHLASKFTNFAGTAMIHTGILSGCATCHNGQVFAGVNPVSKPANHLPTSMACETCHSASKFTNFTGTAMVHTGILSGCATCHNGQVFAGVTPVAKPGNHLPTSGTCETCHSASKFTNFSGTAMNHVGIVNNCTSCHSDGMTFAGVTPKRKQDAPTTHLTTSLDCSSCHFSTTTFKGAAGITSQPVNHVPTTQACALCHAAGYGTGSGVMVHTGILNGCATCHNGQSFAGVTPVSKPSNHLPTTAACELCHSASKFTNFSGTPMVHTGILSGCATCHNGQVFAGVTPVAKPGNHLPTTAACELCHSASKFTNFAGTAMVHTGILSGCTTCHNGQVFAGVTPVSKPSNHLPTTAACELCHSASKFTNFAGTAMIHTGIVSGCATCHNGQVFAGVTPVKKPTNHLATSGACEVCHSVTQFTNFSGAPMNHVGIVNNCTSCHNGQVFAGVTPKSKSSNHIPYATSFVGGATMACEFCHSTTVFTSFSSGLKSSSIMHNGTKGNGTDFWCKTCHASGTSFIGVQGKKSVTHESSTATDCSQSGCHRPLGNEGSLYTSF